MLNPTTGREQRWGSGTLARSGTHRRIVVVGAGPAGMRFAATAARRGHRVKLFERAAELGGRLRLEAAFPRRNGWLEAIEYLAGDLDRAGVDVHLATSVDAADVVEKAADTIVCATGSRWDLTGFTPLRADRKRVEGLDRPHVIDLASAVRAAAVESDAHGKRVVIVDDTGEYAPLGLAEVMAGTGSEVTIVTPRPAVGDVASGALETPYVLPRLAELGVKILSGFVLEAIHDLGVELVERWSSRQQRLSRPDRVVISMGRSADDRLYRELTQRELDVHRIGDAVAPRSVAEAIFDGERLARLL
jgi:NADPH-dependent 2,4-dienoyl-CoA reductase/sulfur reductase-like enzyme